jgi:hypothetical protein
MNGNTPVILVRLCKDATRSNVFQLKKKLKVVLFVGPDASGKNVTPTNIF